jgi:hypothetical protein
MMASLARNFAGRLLAAWAARRSYFHLLTPSRGREFRSQLEAEKEALENFTAAMEDEFLELGALLRKIVSLARQVRDRSDEVMAAASGRSEDAAIQFAFQLLKKAEDLVHASREQYHNVFAVFGTLHADLMQVARERSWLMRTLSPLETTTTQFRIQACAFDESTRTQFFALAEAIGGIVKDVQIAVDARFEELDRTGRETGDLVTSLTALAEEQKRDTSRMLAESRDHLSTLNEVLAASEMAAKSISQAGAKITSGVGKAIVALQCQDMARQKFQHINAAIDDMADHLGEVLARRLTGDEEADCRHFLAGAGRVQLGQLRAVFGQLDEAAGQVGEGMREVDSEAKSFADHASLSGNAALDGQVIERTIDSIHGVLGVIDTAVASVRSVAELVQKLKSSFSDCTSQILGLALRLRMVALNAQIFAAHVDAGAALEVVAQNTRTVADEAMLQLDNISSRVTGLVDLVVDLEQRLDDYRVLAALERDLLAGEAGESETKLRALKQELRSAVAAIGPLDRELSTTVRRATERIRFPEAVAEASARSLALFEQIVLECSDSERSTKIAAHQKVRELKENYTMAHEREVHESVVEGAVPHQTAFQPLAVRPAQEDAAESAPTGEIEANDEKLADNVELF